ncbi:endonuclease/exonuclease/phosphatase family protein [Rhodococcoides trifolii]|nr:endonuclease/exonuclease/phosphatase family protein [Rhodococcus trifolii]
MSVGRVIAGFVGITGVLVGVLGLFAFFTGHLVLLASFVPILLVVAAIGTVVLAAVRQWVLVIVGAIVIVIGAVTQAPLFVENSSAGADGRSVRLMQANLMLGKADASALVAMVRDRNIDILTVEELTDEAVEGLREAGLEDVLLHQFLAPFTLGGGTGIYSRFPVSDGRNLDGYILGNLVADLDVGASQPLTLFAVHPIAPFPRSSEWMSEMTRLRGDAAAVGDGTVVLSGDFNSTYSHRKFRDFFDDGFTDAADWLGAGIIPTYPTDMAYPPVVAIDHVLTKNADATSIESFHIAGSDHRGLVADIRLAE